jgi:MazG family protein
MDKQRLSKALVSLYEIMRELRGPDGCPWDAKQTDATVKMYLLEEAYEVLDAVESGDTSAICEELGDLFFQILFLAKLAEEEGAFSLLDVMENIKDKMIRRHPHVFGQVEVNDADEVAQNWKEIKTREKESTGEGNKALALESIPAALPALLRAHRLLERAPKGLKGIGEEDHRHLIGDICHRVDQAIERRDRGHLGEEMGDLLFQLAGLVQEMGLNAEHLLRQANLRFLDRYMGGKKNRTP